MFIDPTGLLYTAGRIENQQVSDFQENRRKVSFPNIHLKSVNEKVKKTLEEVFRLKGLTV